MKSFFAALTVSHALSTVAAESPKETIQALNNVLDDAFNKQDFDFVAKHYHTGAEILPTDASEFVTQNLASFFKEAYESGLQDLHLETLNVVVEEDDLWHEIGNVTTSEEPEGNLYYVRWVRHRA
mgnify:CR=1 FL=1